MDVVTGILSTAFLAGGVLLFEVAFAVATVIMRVNQVLCGLGLTLVGTGFPPRSGAPSPAAPRPSPSLRSAFPASPTCR